MGHVVGGWKGHVVGGWRGHVVGGWKEGQAYLMEGRSQKRSVGWRESNNNNNNEQRRP